MCMIMMIYMCIRRVKSMYYILLLSQMSKLQFCSESNYAAIFQLNSLSGKILFFLLQIGNFFFGNWEKRRKFWIGNVAFIRPLVIGRKGPDDTARLFIPRFPVRPIKKIPVFRVTQPET